MNLFPGRAVATLADLSLSIDCSHIVSHGGSGTESEYAPTDFQKTAASIVASMILAVGQVVYSVFRFVFSILASLA